jgi:hypothetical protein
MTASTKQISIHDLSVDATHMASRMRDLPPGARKGMRKEQRGFREMLKELVDNQPRFGELAGITPTNFQELVEAMKCLDELDALEQPTRKLLEYIVETRAYEVDQIHRMVSVFGAAIDKRAKAYKDDTLLAAYQLTRAYRSASANKAARTRLRNQEQVEPEQPEIE